MIPPKAVEKLQKRVAALEAWRYAPVAMVPLEVAETEEHFRTPPRLAFAPIAVGGTWGAHWRTAWFRGTISVPRSCRGRRVYYRHCSFSDKLLFVDGAPFAGMNPMHPEVLLTAKAKGGERFRIHVEAYTGHAIPGADPFHPVMYTHQFTGRDPGQDPPLRLEASELLVERETVSGLFYDASVLLKTALMLDGNSLRRARILDTLNAALDLVPMHWDSEEELEAAARAAARLIAPLLKRRNSETTPFVAIAGHTHIDIGWLWPIRESIRKGARTFATFLNLMEDYPELRFMQSQPVLLDMIETHYPSMLPRIAARVKQGRWEPNGGMWVEADCNVTGGEALVRQFLEGRKTTEALFGYASDTLWLPDVFGYSAALPQILQQCEIEHFVTSKINWNDTNHFPYDTFWWAGIDGTPVFTHYITTRNGAYNAFPYPEAIKDTWDWVQRKDTQDSALASIGYGDGGGGVNREMIEHLRRVKDLEGCPRAEFVSVSAYLNRLRKEPRERPTWVGELYLEIHRATYTAQARTKRYNRKLELLLREVELWSVMAERAGVAYPKEALERHWRTVLTNQFHDILPGSSIRCVYEVAEAEYADADLALLALRTEALQALAPGASAHGRTTWVLGNALSWPREDLVVVPGKFTAAWDADGNVLPVQRLEHENALAVVVACDALAVSTIATGRGNAEGESPFVRRGNRLETPHYRMRFDTAGKIASLYDKAAEREIVQPGRRVNDFYTADDMPVYWDAWDLDRYYRDTVRSEDRLESIETIADGPLCHVVRVRYGIGKRSSLVQDITFYAHSPRIDFKTEVEWHEVHTVLKVGFAVDVHATSWRNEIQYGHIVRATHANTSFDQAKFEVCAHKWVDLSEPGYGVALLNDCKYGHDSLDGMISLTLLTAPLCPDEQADQGHHLFTYALLPHLGDFCVEDVVREAYHLNQPVTLAPAARDRDVLPSSCLLSVSNPNVIVEAIKKAEREDAVIVRLYEAGGSRGSVTVEFGFRVKRVRECNLMERNGAAMKVKGNAVNFEMRPFQIKTLKVYRAE